ncbi:MAG: IS5 family transposase [Acidaminococcaceae bacterium]|nr:IS5 family transposase [Acidaminococcaceae bacterium]
MYRKETQLAFEDFVFPFGELDPENEWVKLAKLVPWETVEREYAKQFVDNGHPAHSARIALGALIINQRLKYSDEWTVRHVSENPYLQFFLGMKEYSSKAPFGASTMVEFRKRFPPEAVAAILEASIPKKVRKGHDDQAKPGGSNGQEAGQNEPEAPSNSGTLIMDATCCPADIAFPQDFQLLNHARELLEDIVREISKAKGWKPPRMYSKIARKAFLNLSKSKKRSTKAIRKCIRQQLHFIRRDIGYITNFIRNGGIRLDQTVCDLLNTLITLYEQQLYMLKHRVHSVPDRIVSIRQPWVRPIVRGKAHANTEFGAKLHISMVDGYVRIERLSFDAFNEVTDFFQAVEGFRERYGVYPARVLADKIYRNRETIAWCRDRGIQLTGPAMGRPPKNPEVTKAARQREYQDICERNM